MNTLVLEMAAQGPTAILSGPPEKRPYESPTIILLTELEPKTGNVAFVNENTNGAGIFSGS